MSDTKISALSPATTLAGTEIVPLVQAGANVRATAAQIAALAGNSTAVTATGSSVARALVDRFAERVNLLDFLAAGVNARVAAQNAVNRLAAAGGGVLDIPAGTYQWDCATPLILPSNITVQGVKGQTRIVPMMGTVLADKAFPLASGACIVTGDPATGYRAGVTSGGSVNAATTVANVHVAGLVIDNSGYTGAALAAGRHLAGIQLFFVKNGSISDCEAYNLPNTGLYVYGGRHVRVRDNIAQGCGFLVSEPGSLNGISTVGWMDAASQAQSSVDVLVTGNQCLSNAQEGIQNSTWKGAVIKGNVLIGNREYGIEGESLISGTASSLGYEVPADAIVEGNYVDSYDAAANAYGKMGINWISGNEGRVVIAGNTVRNVLNSSGIATGQASGGRIVVRDNYLENVQPDNSGTQHQIVAIAQYVKVEDNTFVNCGPNGAGVCVLGNPAGVVVRGNTAHGTAPSRLVIVAADAGTSAASALEYLDVSNNTCPGASKGMIQLSFPHNATVGRVIVRDNQGLELNSSAGAAEGFLRLIGPGSGYTLAIGRLDCSGNSANFAGATAYPIMVDAVAGTVAITTAHVAKNLFGTPTNPGPFSNPSAVANLYASDNGTAGQRVTRGAAAPTTGTWATGDLCVNSAPTPTAPVEWECTAPGTPGTWTPNYFAPAPTINSLARFGGQRKLAQVAQRCGGNGEQATPGGGNPYLAQHTRHLCPGGADAIQVVYAGFNQLSTTEAATGPSMFTAASVTVSGGTGYAAGEIVAMAITTATGITAAKVLIPAVTSGVPDYAEVVDGGAYNTRLSAGASQASTTGSGTGATFTFAWKAVAIAGKVGIEPVWNSQVFTGANSVKAVYKGVKADGQRNNTILVPSGDFYVSDLVEVDVPVGGAIGLRCGFGYSGVPLGRLPMTTAYGSGSDVEQANKITTYVAQDLSGTITAAASSKIYQPVAILGIPKVALPTIFIMGNSREAMTSLGTNAIGVGFDVMDADGNVNWIEKALSAGVGSAYWPWSNHSRGSDRFGLIVPPSNPAIAGRAGRMKAIALMQPTAVFLNDAVNDFTNGATLAATQALEAQLIQEIKGMGVKYVFTCTTDPVTTSTDSWATLANQTPSSSSANRIARNAALRGGTYAPYDFYIDFSPVTESSVGSDKWVVSGAANYATGDGTHCSPAIMTLKANLAAPVLAANITL